MNGSGSKGGGGGKGGGGKPPGDDLFERIREEAAKDDAERILAMTDEELDAELRALGYDPVEVRRKGRELGERLVRERR